MPHLERLFRRSRTSLGSPILIRSGDQAVSPLGAGLLRPLRHLHSCILFMRAALFSMTVSITDASQAIPDLTETRKDKLNTNTTQP